MALQPFFVIHSPLYRLFFKVCDPPPRGGGGSGRTLWEKFYDLFVWLNFLTPIYWVLTRSLLSPPPVGSRSAVRCGQRCGEVGCSAGSTQSSESGKMGFFCPTLTKWQCNEPLKTHFSPTFISTLTYKFIRTLTKVK